MQNTIVPDCPEKILSGDKFQQALALHTKGQLSEAEPLYQAIIAEQPKNFDAWHMLGVLEAQRKNVDVALQCFERAININAKVAAVYVHQANVFLESGRFDDALKSYDQALVITPDDPALLANRGVTLQYLNRLEEALATYQKVLEKTPNSLETLSNMGSVLRRLNRPQEALKYYDQAVSIDPNFSNALFNQGTVLLNLKRYEEAARIYEKLVDISPRYPYAWGRLFSFRRFCCDWKDYVSLQTKVIQDVREGKQGVTPLDFLAISDSAQEQLICARTYAADKHPISLAPLWKGQRYEHIKIRVAYVSADFREHAVSVLMAGVFEKHDRRCFDVIGVSLRPEENSPMGRRVKASFDQFIDAINKSDYEIAALLRAMEVDIAVDLTGFTADGRTSIFAHRFAPIQINYLGFPATMGVEYMDYILADEFLIPPHLQKHYAEKVVYLPDCFQANDDKRKTPDPTPTRLSLGLPETGFVFCSFNNNYKMSPIFFDVWMRLLDAVEGSVLWLLADYPAVETNLRREACVRGIDPSRLVFAGRVPYKAHLARLSQADLFLDSLPFNAGTTASDALWAGVPLITCAGEAFAARMAGSLLTAIGLPELITHDLAAYEKLAINLALDKEKYAEIKARVVQNRATHSLFNTERFCHHLESAYQIMWQRYQQGDRPESFKVPARETSSASVPALKKSTLPGSIKSQPMVEVICATRLSADDFWNTSALGHSLKRLHSDTRLVANIVFENQKGLPDVYNSIISAQNDHDILVFMHDDVWIDDSFFVDRVIEGCQTYDVIGVAGNRRRVDKQPAWTFNRIEKSKFIWDDKSYLSGSVAHGDKACGVISRYGPVPASCELLDGVLLAAKKYTLRYQQVFFDARFSFHFYDMDFCRSARSKGLRLGTWPICLTHQSSGKFGGKAWQENYHRYLEKWRN